MIHLHSNRILSLVGISILFAIVSFLLLVALRGQAPQPRGTSTPQRTGAPGRVVPMLLISRNVPAFSSNGYTPASYANDNTYDTDWRSQGSPAWLTYDLSKVSPVNRTKVLVVWYNDSFLYDHTIINDVFYNIPYNYTIDVNAASGSGNPPASGWVTLLTITGNNYHSRQHLVDMTGYNWIRFNCIRGGGNSGPNCNINMDLYNANLALEDDFIDYGDSITAGAMAHYSVNGTKSFAEIIHAQRPDRFPIEEDGGIGYLASDSGAKYINTWLPLFPGKYVGLSYGTNDSWGCGDPQAIAIKVYNSYVTMVKAVIAAGKIPIVPHMIWSKRTDVQICAVAINAKLDQLRASYPQVLAGPDLFAIFQNHAEYLNNDGVHPNDQGVVVYRQAWANTFITSIYKSNAILSTPSI